MKRVLVHVLISLIIFSVFWTCKNDIENKDQSGFLIQKQSFDFGSTGLSSFLPWPPSYYRFGDDYLLIYNAFGHCLDTLKIVNGEFRLKKTRDLEIEGPESVTDFYTFFNTQNLNVFIKGNAVQLIDPNSEYYQFKFDEHVKSVVGDPYLMGRITDNLSGQIHNSFNYDNDCFYFFAQNMITDKLFLFRWDLNHCSMFYS